MRYLLIITFLAFAAVSCDSNKQSNKQTAKLSASNLEKISADSSNYTSIQWLDSIKNIGTLQFGEKKQIEFRFKNTGSKPLYVINAIAGCGCTVADYPKEPISPGNEGVILAGFDTNKVSDGEFRKSITVVTNTNPSVNHLLYFTGVIKKKGEKQGNEGK